MADYITKAACRGVRPAAVNRPYLVPRPHLINKLLGERGVARFIKASPGMGKSVLAADYAQMLFAFEHCLWLDAQSPCFLRELDTGVFCDSILAVDGEARLVIIDDVPILSDERAEELSDCIDGLLGHGVEVVVTMLPSSDGYAARQLDRITIGRTDLMLSEGERSIVASERDWQHPEEMPAVLGIPCLAWGSSEEAAAMLKRCVDAEHDARIKLAAFSLLLFEHDASPFVEHLFAMGAQERAVLAESFPQCGIDEAGMHLSYEYPVDTVVRAFRASIANDPAPFGSFDEACRTLASALVGSGRSGRACELMQFARAQSRAGWLIQRELNLVDTYAFVETERLSASISGVSVATSMSLRAMQAWRCAVAGAKESALAAARSVLASTVASPMAETAAAVLLAAQGTSEDGERALRVLAQLGSATEGMERPENGADVEAYLVWKPLATMRYALEGDVGEAYAVWKRWQGSGADARIVMLAAGWLLSRLQEAQTDGVPGGGIQRMALDIASWVIDAVERDESDHLGFFAFGAIGVYVQTRSTWGLPELGFAASVRVERASRLLFQQQEKLREHIRLHIPFATRTMDAIPQSFSAQRYQPLRVRLFGGMKVYLGDTPLDFDACKRHKVKTLFALLVIESGRELTRDAITADLWPESDPIAARSSLYTVWSLLKHVVVGPDGVAPYLVSKHGCYRIEARYVESDLNRLNDLCRHLMALPTDADSWLHLLEEFEACYCGDLFPGESGSAIIARARREYHNRVLTTLLTVSKRLLREGRADLALQFAQAAYRHDCVREDVNHTLMDAQLALGQRTSALDTYLTFRQYLARELGLDPAPELVELYRSIIEEETELDI